jgi:integrase/recombinase XerD
VLRGTEVLLLLEHLPSVTHRALAMLCNGAGLRVSEACTLKLSDIDSQRGIIMVRSAKGNKDRTVAMSPRLLQALRDYLRQRKPQGAVSLREHNQGSSHRCIEPRIDIVG